VTVVATAGHVDHGKSTLVRALTGVDPDRLAEEKARGLTIDLGFAFCSLPGGAEVSFVDVPGHTRFLKNMLAGVGAVQACLFVVAATEGWKPQSEEHLRILELLGVGTGVVALTKVGLVDDEWREIALLDLADHLRGSFLEAAPAVSVDVPAGIGLEELRGALAELVGALPEPGDRGRPRLWVDRVFAARGSGTVCTGTLAGGGLALEDDVEVIGDRVQRGRVRALQRHGEPVGRIGPGNRVAVNVAGVPHGDIRRGHAVVRPEQWWRTRVLDASLRVLPQVAHEVSHRGAYAVHLGSGEHPARLRVLGGPSVAPGTTGAVRLWLAQALPLVPGDRYVLREAGRDETVGGGEVLDVAPVLPASRARPDRRVERVVAERGFIEVDLLERLTGERRPATLAGRWLVDDALRARLEAELLAEVGQAGPLGLDLSGRDERTRALLAELGGVEIQGGRARRAGAAGPDLAGHPYLERLRREPFAPPPPDGVARAELRALVTAGLVVDCDGVLFAATAVAAASERIATLLAEAPEGVTVAGVRDALGTSRKYLLPLLAHLDATGVTRRRGDVRVAGPRLPRLPAPRGPEAGS
jgi:selenocysteine-specific elongation factor